MRLALLLLLVSTLLAPKVVAVASEPAGAAGGAGPGWDVLVRPTSDLSRLVVRCCFRGYLPRRLVPADGATLRSIDFPPNGPLQPDAAGRFLTVRRLDARRCVEYVVDVEHLLRDRAGIGDCYRAGRDLVLWPGAWLLRPAQWPDGLEATLRFDLPLGMRVATPWPRHAGSASPHFRIDRYAIIRYGAVAFGRFDPFPLRAEGCEFEVVLLDGPTQATRKGIERWLTVAARVVTDLYRGFPARHVLVLIRPVAGGGQPVLFGRTTRGGGSCITLLLSSRAKDEELPGEWVAVHEMIHLGMPLMRPSESWLAEGFVQYYNEVLRARAGLLSERGGWQKLHEGFGRGRRTRTGRSLLEESRRMHETRSYWRVYWAGAALALESDLAIRRGGTRARSLDDVIRYLHRELAPSNQLWDGLEVLRRADTFLGRPVLVPLARTALARSRFPALDETYASLGLAPDGWVVRYVPGAVERGARRAIMSPGGGYPDASRGQGEGLARPP